MTIQQKLKQKYEGQTFDLRYGYKATIIEYIASLHVIIKWSDGITSKTTMEHLNKRSVRHPSWSRSEWQLGYKYTDIIGKTYPMKNNCHVTITKIENIKNVHVTWDDGTKDILPLHRIYDKAVKHPNWSKSEWQLGVRHKDLCYDKLDAIGLPVSIIDIKNTRNIKIQYANGLICPYSNVHNFFNSPCIHPDLQVTYRKNKRHVEGKLWDTQICGYSHIDDGIHYVICMDNYGKTYTISIPALYENNTNKPYPYHLIQDHMREQEDRSKTYSNIQHETMKEMYENKTFKTRNNLTCTVTKYNSVNNVIVTFSDGAETTTQSSCLDLQNNTAKLRHPNWSLSEWMRGYRDNDIVGKQFNLKNGYTATILTIDTVSKVKILWSDGTESTTSLSALENNQVKHPDWTLAHWMAGSQESEYYEGMIIPIKHQLSITIIKIHNCKNIDIQWSDGAQDTVSAGNLRRNQIRHPDWSISEWKLGKRHSDIIATTYFDFIGLPVKIDNMRTTKDMTIKYATNECRNTTWRDFNKAKKLPPSFYIGHVKNKPFTRGTLWDIKILNIAYILNHVTYLTCEKPNGDRYITSVPELYEEKTGKSYPHAEFQKHLKEGE